MKVTVLFGGPSAEREVSLVSGRSVIDGLKQAGHDVFASDIAPNDLSALTRHSDVIFPVLHGAFGENGELQRILEHRGVPFVGSGSAASRAGMNKDMSKRLWVTAGLPTAPHVVVQSENTIRDALAKIGVPAVVKPVDGGSSIGVKICKTTAEAHDHAKMLVADLGSAMIERFIKGTELTIGILEHRALPPIRITTSHEFFDYNAKYVGNSAQHHFDLNLPDQTIDFVKKLAIRAHESIGARDLSRLDVMIDEQNRPWLLEINTMPGFTPKSLLPEMAAAAGINFVELVDRLVERALARGASEKRAAG